MTESGEAEKASGEGENWRKGEEGKGRKKRNTSVKRLLDVSQVEFVDVTSIAEENEFLNMNTFEEYQIIQSILISRKNNYPF
ncbi:MAG: hypothetical protein U5K00_10975 [Melioribacteraceae bacterium]|nr:hypothetical protein [Melioribacteraceae bacterium]